MDTRVTKLERYFGRVAGETMADLPIANAALDVEAVGFRPWNEALVGTLITPWAINLVRLPDDPGETDLGPGSKREHRFPGGTFAFLEGEEADFGPYGLCSLFSPVTEFVDQEAARIAARAAVAEVFAENEAPGEDAGGGSRGVSRRGFLRGTFTDTKGVS